MMPRWRLSYIIVSALNRFSFVSGDIHPWSFIGYRILNHLLEHIIEHTQQRPQSSHAGMDQLTFSKLTLAVGMRLLGYSHFSHVQTFRSNVALLLPPTICKEPSPEASAHRDLPITLPYCKKRGRASTSNPCFYQGVKMKQLCPRI